MNKNKRKIVDRDFQLTNTDNPPLDFDHIFSKELEAITSRRLYFKQNNTKDSGANSENDFANKLENTDTGDCDEGADNSVAQEAGEAKVDEKLVEKNRGNLFGVALSGGGIRSATFNLGILQSICKYKLLKQVDYLSLNSGGGYIGGWLAAWIKRDGIEHVQERLSEKHGSNPPNLRDGDPQKERIGAEPIPISHLRHYTNYLTPRTGLLSIDTWVLIMTYLRNFLLNLMLIGLATASAIYLIRGIIELARPISSTEVSFIVLSIAPLMFVIAAVITFVNLNNPQLRPMRFDQEEGKGLTAGRLKVLLYEHPQLSVVIPIFLASVLMAKLNKRQFEDAVNNLPNILSPISNNPHATLFVYVLVIWGILSVRVFRRHWKYASENSERSDSSLRGKTGMAIILISIGTTIATIAGIHGALSFVDSLEPSNRITLGTPSVVSMFILTNVCFVGLAGRMLTEGQRQWLTQLMSWLLIYSIGWVLIVGVVDLLPSIFQSIASRQSMSSLLLPFVLLVTSLIVSALAAYFGHRLEAYQESAESIGRVFLKLAPFVFFIGIIASGSSFIIPMHETQAFDRYIGIFPSTMSLFLSLFMSYGLYTVTTILSRRIDINKFSMHNFYRLQLVRAFLGASRGQRDVNTFTNFSPKDDLPLHDLRFHIGGEKNGGYDGPLPIFNCSLNLAGSNQLVLQERKADSFTFSPYHFGYNYRNPEPKMRRRKKDGKVRYVTVSEPAYRPVENFKNFITTGLAMAISGAAISPNMGYRSTKALAFLLTVFNLRLGAWITNTRKAVESEMLSPPGGLASLYHELFAQTNDESDYIYLSDGGHFENLAAYELIRRKCHYIVVVDAGADPTFAFADLGNLIRKSRSDFGTNIEIEVASIRPNEDGQSRSYFAVGKIRYDQVDSDRQPGFLIYIKASLIGNETVDIAAYKRQHPAFPHQSTVDQWFTESQFDSYRALGYQVGTSVFGNCGEDDSLDMPLETFFSHIRRAAYPVSDRTRESFTNHAGKLQDLLADLSSDDKLGFLDWQLFPDSLRVVKKLDTQKELRVPPFDSESFRHGFYFCSRLLQLMENVFIDLRFDRESEHPDNRGWLNLFNYWAGSDMLNLVWSASASTYGARFQKFCRDILQLSMGDIEITEHGIENDFTQSYAEQCEKKGDLSQKEKKKLGELFSHRGKLASDMEIGTPTRFWTFDIRTRVVREEQKAQKDDSGAKVEPPSISNGDRTETGKPFVNTGSNEKKHKFSCGFAITDNDNRLVYMRLRDHLRGLGLARRVIKEFVKFPNHPVGMAPEARELYKVNSRDPKRGRYLELLLHSMLNSDALGP